MKFIESIQEMQEYSRQLKREGKIIASIETAGYLHEGHMSLIKIAKENADVVILSIAHLMQYITYFKDYEDYLKEYKQNDFISDIEFCQLHGVDIVVHIPDSSWNYQTSVDIPFPYLKRIIKDRGELALRIEEGLGIWAEQFNVIRPDVTILGQKDIYQNFVVKSIIDKLNFPIKVIMAPIIRDSDGLACSSRNKFLTRSERERAISIYKTLHEVSTWSNYAIDIGSAKYIKEYITSRVQSKWCSVDICCAETFEELDSIDRDAIIILAAGPFGRKGIPLHELVNGGAKGFLTDNIFVYQ